VVLLIITLPTFSVPKLSPLMAVVVEAPTVKPFRLCWGRVVQKDGGAPLVIVVRCRPFHRWKTHR